MMVQLGQLKEQLQAATDYTTNTEIATLMSALNMAYYDLAGSASWVALRRKIALVSIPTGGYWLPGNLAGIDRIWDADGNDYPIRELGNTFNESDARYRAVISEVCREPLVYQRGVSIDSGTKALAFDPAISQATIGEYIAFGKQLGCYYVETADTLELTYYGPTINNEFFQIRPIGTKKLKLIDYNGDDLAATVNIAYWQYPPPLYADHEIIQLPTTEALFYKTLMRLNQFKRNEGRAKNLQNDYAVAYSDMLARNPAYEVFNAPAFRTGEEMTWGR
ncbi:MAG TPA: hypothetical protein PKM67_11190 [Kiritimatiellia bacterium]|nr:hypothetical protein [Kiritimatiellia bacterium]HNS82011.1 hypothetical protein [Kiritimatiellia bacterium]